MTSIFIIYIIGYIISLCIFVFNDIKEDDIYLCDLLGIMLISLLSWMIVIAAIIAIIWQYVEDNWNIVIFKKKKYGNK
jgi:prolipoprotein diacylglyceryltransferase